MSTLLEIAGLVEVAKRNFARGPLSKDDITRVYTVSDAESWLTSGQQKNEDDSRAGRLAKLHYEKGDFIHEEALNELGVNVEEIKKILDKHKHEKNITRMAMYLNSRGLLRPRDQVACCLKFYTDYKEQDGTKYKDKKSKIGDMHFEDADTLALATCKLTRDDYQCLADEIRQRCVNTSVQSNNRTVDLEEMTHDLRKVICEGPLNIEGCLNEIVYQITEPVYLSEIFRKETLSAHALPREAGQKLKRLLRTKPISLVKNNFRLAVMKEDCYQIILPRRWRLKGQDSTVIFDILLNQFYGADAGEIRTVYELVNFCEFSHCTTTDMVLAIIDKLEKGDEFTHHQVENLSLLEFIYHLRKVVCCIAFLEMARQLLPEMVNVEVGCVDDRGDKESVELNKRILAQKTLYYFKNDYYMALGDRIYKSDSYAALLSTLLLNEPQIR